MTKITIYGKWFRNTEDKYYAMFSPPLNLVNANISYQPHAKSPSGGIISDENSNIFGMYSSDLSAIAKFVNVYKKALEDNKHIVNLKIAPDISDAVVSELKDVYGIESSFN